MEKNSLPEVLKTGIKKVLVFIIHHTEGGGHPFLRLLLGTPSKKKPVKLVTLSKKVGRGQDQITIFSPSKIVTCLTGGGVCSSNVTISFSTFYGIFRL